MVGYFWLSHGRRTALAAAITGGGVVLLGHALYWPEILKLWSKWLPAAWTPFLDRFRVADGGTEAWSAKVAADSARGIILDTFRKHFVPMAGAVGAALCYPGLPVTPEQEQRRRDMVFLGAVMVVLAGIHGYATLGLTYCPWCLATYGGFSLPVGLVMLAIAGAHWLPQLGPTRRMVSAAFLLVLPSAVGQGLKGTLFDSILATQVPRASFSAILRGRSGVSGKEEPRCAFFDFHTGWDVDVGSPAPLWRSTAGSPVSRLLGKSPAEATGPARRRARLTVDDQQTPSRMYTCLVPHR